MNTRHWKLIQGFALAALLPLCVACSSEDDNLPLNEEKQPVQVNITRATIDGNDWSWQNNDQVGLSINGTTQTLTYNNASWAPAITGITLPATVEAWYPVSASMDEFEISHNSNEYQYAPGYYTVGGIDQSSSDKLAEMDYMTTDDMTASSASLNLTLQHRMCLVTIIIVGYDGFGSTSPTIEDVRMYTFTPIEKSGDEYLTAPTGDGIDIQPYEETDSNNRTVYKAIVAPYFYDEWGLPLITMKVNGTLVSARIPSSFGDNGNGKLSSGKAYTFNLTVKNPNATTRSASTSECELELVEVQDMNEE